MVDEEHRLQRGRPAAGLHGSPTRRTLRARVRTPSPRPIAAVSPFEQEAGDGGFPRRRWVSG